MSRRLAPRGLELLLWAFVLWLYGGDLWLWYQARTATVAALAQWPSVPLGLVGLVVGLAGAATWGRGLLPGTPEAWRPRRLALVAAVLLLFVDLAVLSSRRSVQSADELAVGAVHGFARLAEAQAAPQGVVRDPGVLTQLLAELGPVPYFVRGELVAAWKLELRERCQGPATDVAGATPGTLIYCVGQDRKTAWVTLAGLPLGERTGSLAVLGAAEPAVAEVHAPQEGPAEAPVWGPPTRLPE